MFSTGRQSAGIAVYENSLTFSFSFDELLKYKENLLNWIWGMENGC